MALGPLLSSQKPPPHVLLHWARELLMEGIRRIPPAYQLVSRIPSINSRSNYSHIQVSRRPGASFFLKALLAHCRFGDMSWNQWNVPVSQARMFGLNKLAAKLAQKSSIGTLHASPGDVQAWKFWKPCTTRCGPSTWTMTRQMSHNLPRASPLQLLCGGTKTIITLEQFYRSRLHLSKIVQPMRRFLAKQRASRDCLEQLQATKHPPGVSAIILLISGLHAHGRYMMPFEFFHL